MSQVSGSFSHLTLSHQKITIMKRNMGNADRIIRILIVLAIALLYYFKLIEGTFANVLLAIAGIFLVTSLIGFCPAYSVFGIKTCSFKKTSSTRL